MAILNSVSAFGSYANENKSEINIEQGFDFDISVTKEEACEKMGLKYSYYKNPHVIIRVCITGEIEDAVFKYIVNDEYKIEPADEYHEDFVNELIDRFHCVQIASCKWRRDMLNNIAKISETQSDNAITAYYGILYKKYIETYSGYALLVFKHGKPMIFKKVYFVNEHDTPWQIFDPNNKSKEDIQIAKELVREYTIRDNLIDKPDEIVQKRLQVYKDYNQFNPPIDISPLEIPFVISNERFTISSSEKDNIVKDVVQKLSKKQ